MERNYQYQSYGLQKKQQQLVAGTCPGFGGQADKFYRCDVIFGSPTAACRGTGICKIVAQQSPATMQSEPQQCQRTQAIMAWAGEDKTFSMILFPEFMCSKLFKNHLRNGVLEMKEPCPLPQDLIKALGIPTHTIPAGNYPIEIKMGYYQINFTRWANWRPDTDAQLRAHMQ